MKKSKSNISDINDIPLDSCVKIFTDGACSGNPGPGGWGFLLKCDDYTFEKNGGEKETTNNRMEMKAAIEALKILKEGQLVVLTTDSTYLRDGITSWIKNWKKNNWINSQKKPVKNKDLWEDLDILQSKLKITWNWVKAHNGHEENEKADMLARQGVVSIQMNS